MRGKNGLRLQKVNKYCLLNGGIIMIEAVLTKEGQEILDNVLTWALHAGYPSHHDTAKESLVLLPIRDNQFPNRILR